MPQGPGRTVVCFARGVDLRSARPVSKTPGMERRACAMGLYSAPQRRTGRALRLTYTEKALGLRKACPSNRISPLGPRSGARTQLSEAHRRARRTRAPGVRAPRRAGAPTSYWLVDWPMAHVQNPPGQRRTPSWQAERHVGQARRPAGARARACAVAYQDPRCAPAKYSTPPTEQLRRSLPGCSAPECTSGPSVNARLGPRSMLRAGRGAPAGALLLAAR